MTSQSLIYIRHQLRDDHLSQQTSTRCITHLVSLSQEEHHHLEVILQLWAPTPMRTTNTNWTQSKDLHKLAWITKNIHTTSAYWNHSLLHPEPQEHSLSSLSYWNRSLRTFRPWTNWVVNSYWLPKHSTKSAEQDIAFLELTGPICVTLSPLNNCQNWFYSSGHNFFRSSCGPLRTLLDHLKTDIYKPFDAHPLTFILVGIFISLSSLFFSVPNRTNFLNILSIQLIQSLTSMQQEYVDINDNIG